MTIVDFLLARIAEDEEVAYHAQGLLGIATPWHRVDVLRERGLTRADAEHIARHYPARVLAECEAKRLRVTWATGDWCPSENIADGLLRWEALPYADHPDYREEWRP